MPKYVIANWKCHKTVGEVQDWVTAVNHSGAVKVATSLEVVLCPPFLYLPLVAAQVEGLQLGVQTVSPYGIGAYTGAVAAVQVAQFAHYALLGHAERRQHFGEDSQVVARQVRQALDAQLTPILAVDQHSWLSQLELLDAAELRECLIMYEPPEAISTMGSGQPAKLTEVVAAMERIRQTFTVKAVLYGGSVSATNIDEYLRAPQIDGVVPGAASLDADSFMDLVRRADAAVRTP